MNKDVKVSVLTALVVLVFLYVPKFLRYYRYYGLIRPFKKLLFRVAQILPSVRKQIEDAKKESKEELRKALDKHRDEERLLSLPQAGLSVSEINQKLERRAKVDQDLWDSGKISASLFCTDGQILDLEVKAMEGYLYSNPLHPDIFPSVRQMESEIVNMTLNLFHPTPGCVGSMTTGGSESLIVAMHAYKNWGKKVRGIRHPEIVACVTVHAAIDKAAEYFNMQLIHVPADASTFKVNLEALENAITSDTVCIIGSAPNYCAGIIDDIPRMAAIAKRHRVGLHVDACMGGFVLPFAKMCDYDIPSFDFENDGVTSISADAHKYGNTPKGVSVLMWRDSDWRKHQYVSVTDWTGGIYATPTMTGSKAGSTSVGAWACMMHLGRRGYMDISRKIMQAATYIRQEVVSIEDITVQGDPKGTITAFESKKLNIYMVYDLLKDKGWRLNSQQNPASFHLCITGCNYNRAEEFVRDLKLCVEEAKTTGKTLEGTAAIYGMAAKVPDKKVINDIASFYLDTLYEA